MKKVPILALVIYMAMLCSCDNEFFSTTHIEIEYPPVEPVLVVRAINSPFDNPVVLPSKLTVRLSKLHSLAESYFDDSIGNATVVIKSPQSADTLRYDATANHYSLMKKLEPGTAYELSAYCPGFEVVVARDTQPSKIVPDQILINPVAGFTSEGLPLGSTTITFKDPAGTTNYYEVVVLSTGINLTLASNDAAITQESYYPEIPEMNNFNPKRLLFSDHSFDGQKKTLTIQFHPGGSYTNSTIESYGGIVAVSLRHVSLSYYRYYTSQLQYRFNERGDVLMGKTEPKNLYSNVENGIGIFGFFYEFKKEEYIERMTFQK